MPKVTKTAEQKAADKAAKVAAKGKVAPSIPGTAPVVPTVEDTKTPPTPTAMAHARSNHVPPVKAAKGVTKITFKLHSGATREFTEATHGEDFAAVADEFHTNNEKSNENMKLRKDHVVGRVDE